MKAKAVKQREARLSLPGTSLAEDELRRQIKSAEKGPFITIQELKKDVEEWKKNRKR
jgi:hypothetical protein